jgi:cysteine desulfurase
MGWRGWRVSGWRLYSASADIRNSRVMSRVYLDHAATTPLRPEAREAMLRGFELWANPSSPHAEGRAARAALEDARERVRAALGWDGEVVFTSGASEALAIGLGRAKAERRIVSAVEHDSVFRGAPDAIVLPMAEMEVDREVLAESLAAASRPLVAIQTVNSETGIIQPLDDLARQVRGAGGLLLADCAQSAGKSPLPDADLITVSAHKLGGPPGIGALLIKDFGMIEPSGGQERGYRGGTENLPGALGFAAALDVASSAAEWDLNVADSLFRMENFLRAAGAEIIGADAARSLLITAVAMPNMSAAAQLIHFDRAGFAVSAGSACSSGSLKASRTLQAFGLAPEIMARTIRVSVGWSTTEEDIRAFVSAWIRIAEQAKAAA